MMLNAGMVSATMGTTMGDHATHQLGAAGYLDCGYISPTVASVTEYLDGHNSGCSVWDAAAQADCGDQSNFDCWCSKLSLWRSLLVGQRL